MKKNLKSWKTSALGAGGLIPLVMGVLNQLTDGNALTNPDWNVVVPALMTSVGLLFSRDGDKSSEDVGAVK